VSGPGSTVDFTLDLVTLEVSSAVGAAWAVAKVGPLARSEGRQALDGGGVVPRGTSAPVSGPASGSAARLAPLCCTHPHTLFGALQRTVYPFARGLHQSEAKIVLPVDFASHTTVIASLRQHQSVVRGSRE
jgi:hypothetical protein